MNKAILNGRITKELELKASASGKNFLSFSIATSYKYKNKDTGELIENTTFHNIMAWGKQAETIAQYCVKGQLLLIEGRIDNSQIDKDDGTTSYFSSVVLERFEFGAKPKGAEGSPVVTAKPAAPKSQDVSEAEYPSDDIDPEDIPF